MAFVERARNRAASFELQLILPQYMQVYEQALATSAHR
jgi:hypothetical protein